MDPFDAFSQPSAGGAADFENDPAADFLAREQAELAKIENSDFSSFGGSGAGAPSDSNNFGSDFNRRL